MVHKRVFVAGFVASTVVGTAGLGLATAGPPSSQVSPPPTTLLPPVQRQHLQLTPEQIRAAKDTFLGDPLAQRLLQGVPNLVLPDPGTWTTKGETELLGAVFYLRLPVPLPNVQAAWPVINSDESLRATTGVPYAQVVRTYLVPEVRDLMVMVDLKARRVVSLEPGHESVVNPIPPDGLGGPETGD